jgi:hypothetical protein
VFVGQNLKTFWQQFGGHFRSNARHAYPRLLYARSNCTLVGRKLPLDTPEATTYLRIAYVVSQIIQFGLIYFVSMKIKSKNDLTTLKYVEPKAMGSDAPPTVVTTTVRDYDLSKVSEQTRSLLMGVAMISFMHLYLKVSLASKADGFSHLCSTLSQFVLAESKVGADQVSAALHPKLAAHQRLVR